GARLGEALIARGAGQPAHVGVVHRLRGAPLGGLERGDQLAHLLIGGVQLRLARPVADDVVVVADGRGPVLGQAHRRGRRGARAQEETERGPHAGPGRKSSRVNSVVSGASRVTASRPPSRRSTRPSAWTTRRPCCRARSIALSVAAPVVTTSSRMTT